MTPNQRWLLRTAKDAMDFIDGRENHRPPQGLYDDIAILRRLHLAIAAVEEEEADADRALVAEQLVNGRP